MRNIERPKAIAHRSSGEPTGTLLADIRALIDVARGQVAQAVNAGLVRLHWSVGHRIRQDILKDKRAEYGERIVQTVSAQLKRDYGDGFGSRNLFNMVRFAETFPNAKMVQTLSAQLGWSHFVELIPMTDPLKRGFYAEMCRLERWSVRTLREKIDGMLYERTALSKKPAKLAALELKKLRTTDHLTPDLVFRDPYFLDFLGLKGAYQEKGLGDDARADYWKPGEGNAKRALIGLQALARMRPDGAWSGD